MCCRDQENQFPRDTDAPTMLPKMVEPLQRIFKRLTTYEHPVPPPLLSRNQMEFNCLLKENLYNSASVINFIKPYFKVILDYAQTYNLLVSEHTAVDSSFLELIPMLYKEHENQVTLHALCDPVSPNQKQVRSGTPVTVHCAGPAVIRIKVIKN